MATDALKGNATITYTPAGGVETVHQLAAPLMVRPADGVAIRRHRQLYRDYNADGTDAESFAIGSAYEELLAIVRFENEPDGLRDIIKEGIENNVTLTYSPDGVDDFGCLLIGDGDETLQTIEPDAERWAFGEFQAQLRLRLVSGSFDDLIT